MRTAMTSRPFRPTIDLTMLDLHKLTMLSDEDFRLVVDADMKRAAPRHQDVPAWVSKALRGPLLERWHTTLRRMLADIEGQLEARDAEYEANKARHEMRDDQRSLNELNVRHFEARSRSVRFRTGVKDAVLEAEGLLDSRIARLESAIRAHRDAIGESDPDTTEADRTLWSSLGSFTE